MSFNNDHMGQIVTVHSEVKRTKRPVREEEPEGRIPGYPYITYPRDYILVEWHERPLSRSRAGHGVSLLAEWFTSTTPSNRSSKSLTRFRLFWWPSGPP